MGDLAYFRGHSDAGTNILPKLRSFYEDLSCASANSANHENQRSHHSLLTFHQSEREQSATSCFEKRIGTI